MTAIASALLIAPDQDWSHDVTASLTHAGVTVTHVRDTAEASVSLAKSLPDLCVIAGSDRSMRDHLALQRSMRFAGEDERDDDVPVMVIRADGSSCDESLYSLLGNADIVGTLEAAHELAFRARVLVRRREAQRETSVRAAALRRRSRSVSAAVLASVDPNEIASALVAGLGEMLGADYVMAVTFDDGQLPRVAAFWPPVIAPDVELADSQAEFRELAKSLWVAGSILLTDPLEEWGKSPVRTIVAPWASKLDAATGIIAPIGQGEAATGLVWIGSRTPRTWLPIELGVLQSVALNTGVSLLQSHLVVTLRHALRYSARMNKTHRDLISTISHELRTPLTSISGYLELIREDEALPAHIGAMVDIAERNARLLGTLVDEVVDVSRLGTGDTHEVMPVPLGHLLKTVAADLRVAMEDKHLTCTVTSDERAVVLGNTDQLEQAMISIVHNAVKFTPLGGHLTLSAELHENGCRITVTDSGIGIPGEDLPHIFDRFFRASNATASAIGGLGLGLSLVKQVVADHGGTVNVWSEVGRGTTVVVQFADAIASTTDDTKVSATSIASVH